jgi:membrane-associated phospholipid phosphatase
MARKVADAAFGPTVTAPREGAPDQQRRGRAFLTIYAALVTLATLGFAALVATARTEDVVANFDAPIARAIQSVHVPVLSWLLTHASDLGWFPYDVFCVTIVAVALFAVRLRLEAILIVASTLIAGELGTLVKDLVQRARPTGNFVQLAAHLADFSFPSGHVIFATVLFGTAFWVVWMVWSRSLVRNVVLIALALPILLMGPSRVYLGEHWPTDVLGAYCLAGLWVAFTIEAMLVLKPRFNGWWRGRSHRRSWAGLF